MAEKARTMPGPRGRGPRPKLDHPGQTLGRVLKYVGRKYWLHLIFVVVSIFIFGDIQDIPPPSVIIFSPPSR